jgi:hypothetical protein
MRDVKHYSQRRPSYRRKLLNLNEIDVYTFKSPAVSAISNVTVKEDLNIAGNCWNLNEIDVYTFKSPVVPAMSNITLKEELHIAGNLLMSQL